ncbi:MAG TPA: DUF4142 domain-containing protein, partial [Pedobacter sp.]
IVILLPAVCTVLSCSGVRSASGPSGPVTPSAGSASNIAAGRNTIAAPVGGDDTGVSGRASGDLNADSLANKVDSVGKKERPLQFIREAAISGTAEVHLSEIALKRSQNANMKTFASMMIKDHGEANTVLNALAASKNIQIDALLKSRATDIGEKTNSLSAASDSEFDDTYVHRMLRDHEQAIRLFEAGTKSDDPEVKAYAKKYLPVLKMHLKSIKALSER